MHDNVRLTWLRGWSHFVSRRPRLILALALGLALLSVAWTARFLTFQSNRNELLAGHLEWNQRFINWQREFPGAFDLVVVVDTWPGDDADPKSPSAQAHREQALQAVAALGRRIEQSAEIETAIWGFDTAAFSPKAIRLLPGEAFDHAVRELSAAELLLTSPDLPTLIDRGVARLSSGAGRGEASGPAPSAGLGGLGGLASMLGMGPATPDPGESNQPAASPTEADQPPSPVAAALADDDPGQIQRFEQLVGFIHQVMTLPVDEPLPMDPASLVAPGGEDDWQYLLSPNERLAFVIVSPHQAEGALNAMNAAVASIRQILGEVRAEHPGVDIGLTGIQVVESDETDAAVRDSTLASIVAFVLVTALLVLAFHSWRIPLLAMGTLLVAIAWSFGFLTVAVGHLQVLSVVFCVILLGLGIDFGIHLASTFELRRHAHPDDTEGFSATLQETYAITGPGIVTGAMTTAAAFLTTLWTDFIGVAEMGLIAAAGVLLCLIAMFSVFPAMLRLIKPHHHHIRHMDHRWVHLFEERWVAPFIRRPGLTVGVAFALTLAAGTYAFATLRFDYDLLRLQPSRSPGVTWAQRIAEDGEQSIWNLISVADDLDQAHERVRALRRHSLIAPDFGGVGMLFPPELDERLARLDVTRQTLAPAMDQARTALLAPQPDRDAIRQLAGLRFMMLAARQQAMPDDQAQAMARLDATLGRLIADVEQLEPEVRARRLHRLHGAYAELRLAAADAISLALDTSPLQLSDLPEPLMRPYVSPIGRLVIEVKPRIPDSIPDASPYHPDFLPRFIEQARSVDPLITGVPVQIYQSGSLIRDAYLFAGVVALLLVFILLLIDFRSLLDALFCLAPLFIGFTLTFALTHLVGESINIANIIVLPLMFGMGVDAGVHVLHRYRQNPTRRPLGLTDGAGKGVTLTSLTTAIGFASMMLADHRGIYSLGLVLTMGILLTMLASLIVLPAMLEIRARMGWAAPQPPEHHATPPPTIEPDPA